MVVFDAILVYEMVKVSFHHIMSTSIFMTINLIKEAGNGPSKNTCCIGFKDPISFGHLKQKVHFL